MRGRTARKDSRGMTVPVLILLIAVIAAAVLIFLVPAYRQHRVDQKLTMDNLSVDTAQDVAKIAYLQEGENGLVTYYYDEVRHQVYKDREKLALIEPYGRTTAQDNLNAETDAAGVPNLGGEDGAQLLAVSIQTDTIINTRWTGKVWSYPDYYYMVDAERAQLTSSDLREMDGNSVQMALCRAREQYETDYASHLKKNEMPGTAVYDYDRLTDTVIYDDSMESDNLKDFMAEVPSYAKKTAGRVSPLLRAVGSGGIAYGTVSDLAPYGLSSAGEDSGGYLVNGARAGEYLALFDEAERSRTLRRYASDGSEGCVLQVWVSAMGYITKDRDARTADSLTAAAIWLDPSAGDG